MIILLIVCTLPATLPLFHPGLFDRSDAFQYISRFFEFNLALGDGQFPPLWAPDLDAGYGNPMFMFYSPLFFFAAELPRFIGFSYITCVKTVVISSILLSGVTMFIFAREFWGPFGAFLSAIAYVYAPYHLMDIYARASFTENMAFMWFPLILWSFYKLTKENKITYLVFGSCSLAALVLTHNITAMIFTPVIILYTAFLLILNRLSGAAKRTLAAFLIGLGLSAFFWVPALIEKKYVILSKFVSGYFEFHKHFLNLGNFFFSDPKNPFLYNIPLSFQLGLVAILAVISLNIALKMSFAGKDRDRKYSIIFFLSLVPVCIYMMLPISKWAWHALPLLQFAQFPYRLSVLVVLSLAFVSGAVILLFRQKNGIKNQIVMLAIFSILLALTSYKHTNVPGYVPHAPDEFITSGTIRSIESQVRPWKDLETDTTDYRPKWVKKLTRRVLKNEDKLEVISGDVKLRYANIKTSRYYFGVTAGKDSFARIHTYWFPGWKAYIDGKEAGIDYSNEYGLMDIRVPAGEHVLFMGLFDTPLRRGAKIISLASLFILGLMVFFRKGLSPTGFFHRGGGCPQTGPV